MYDADIEFDALTAQLDVMLYVPMGKNDAVMACVAQLAVPYKLPVIPFVTVNEPVITVLFCAIRPLRAMNSLAIISKSFPYPRLGLL
jgi:hypothetical protein